ncbi:MAG TPA: serine hydrolase [Candidatus Saccharimonadales bacterium]|nr:serine hydrolase [Candidatus Saccharimonadales bacterium]
MNKKALEHSIKYIDSWLNLRYESDNFPGLAVAISHKGKILLNKAYGYADIDKKVKLNPEHIFRIASHSKTFTATALMQLQEKGDLRIDDFVVTYLPWLKKHNDKKWRNVTIRQLMSHGAGIIRDGQSSGFWQLDRPFPDADQLKEEILQSDLVIDNNTKLKYSNFGYSLLGLLIENVSGKSYDKYVIENIVKPLKLKNTGPDFIPEIKNKLAVGYTRKINGVRLPIDNVETKAMSAATGFYSTSEDMCTYFTAQFVGSGKLLKDESKKEMQRTHWRATKPFQNFQEDYGLGIEIEYIKNRRTISHGGGFPGFTTKSIGDPKDQLVVVVLTNCHDGLAPMIAKNIFPIIDYFLKNTPTTKPKHDLSNLEGRYVGRLGMVIDVVVTGDKIVSNFPNNWQPMQNLENLEYIDDTTMEIVDTDSFSNEGEKVIFKIKDGKVESVNYSGSIVKPEKIWEKGIKGIKRITLLNGQ